MIHRKSRRTLKRFLVMAGMCILLLAPAQGMTATPAAADSSWSPYQLLADWWDGLVHGLATVADESANQSPGDGDGTTTLTVPLDGGETSQEPDPNLGVWPDADPNG